MTILMFDQLMKSEKVEVEGYTRSDGAKVKSHSRGGGSSPSGSKGALTVQAKGRVKENLFQKVKVDAGDYARRAKAWANTEGGKKVVKNAATAAGAVADAVDVMIGGNADMTIRNLLEQALEVTDVAAFYEYGKAVASRAKASAAGGGKVVGRAVARLLMRKNSDTEMYKMAEIDREALGKYMEALADHLTDDQKEFIALAMGFMEYVEGDAREEYAMRVWRLITGNATEEDIKEFQEIFEMFANAKDEEFISESVSEGSLDEGEFDTLPEDDE